jgi:hypothetical protein
MLNMLACLTLISIALLFNPTPPLDMGPKPSMNFEIDWEGSPQQEIVRSNLLVCGRADCTDAAPRPEMGPQQLRCFDEKCHIYLYSTYPHHVLEITFADGIHRRSNVFEKKGYIANYRVTVLPGSLQVDERMSTEARMLLSAFLGGCLPFLALLAAILLLIRWLVRRSRRNKAIQEG